MKTFATPVFALLSALAITVASAETFNDRGDDFITRVQPGSQAQYPAVAVTSSHFTDQGEDFIASVQPGSQAQYPAVVATSSHFTDRGEEYVASTAVRSKMPQSSAYITGM